MKQKKAERTVSEEPRELLERAEDAEDLKMLERMRRRPLRFRKLSEFLAERVADKVPGNTRSEGLNNR